MCVCVCVSVCVCVCVCVYVGICVKYLVVSGDDGQCIFHTHIGNPGNAYASLLTRIGAL